MTYRSLLPLIAIGALAWASCASPRARRAAPPGASRSAGATPAEAARLAPHSVDPRLLPEPPQVDALLARMSLEGRVGQMMMIGFNGTEVSPAVAALIRGQQVGGVCLFKRNVADAGQLIRLNRAVRDLFADSVPPFIAVDQEGGNVVRVFDGAVVLPGNMALGATRSRRLAYEAGRTQGEDLKLLGFNMNFAPVLDVNLNPRNPVIGIRSFGDRADLVSDFGMDFVRGQQDANLVTVAKHFPGHGNTDADSHLSLPVMRESAAEMMAQLLPFRTVIQAGLDGLMTAHVAVPRFTGDELPATLSGEVLSELLRKKLRFQGLVVTDELEMESISRRYGVGRAAVMAVKAGADMVLTPWSERKKAEVYAALLEAVRSGELSHARVEESVRRILTVKLRRGLFDAPRPDEERLAELSKPRRRDVAARIARESVTLVRADSRFFPLAAGKRLGVITAEPALAQAISARSPGAHVLLVPRYPKPEQRARLLERAREVARNSDLVVVGVFNSRQLELVRAAASSGKPVTVVSMGLPYLVEQVPEAKAVLALYSFRRSSAEAGVAALFGEQGTPGKLPVSLKQFPFGHGLNPVGEAMLSESTRQRDRTALP